MTGRLAVIGLGPGDPRYLTPEAEAALRDAEALYGYGPYLDRVAARAGPEPPSVRQPRRRRARRRRAGSRRTRRKYRRRLRRRSRRLRHGGRHLRTDRIRAGRLARARCCLCSRHYRDARCRGADRRSARSRFLRAVAVRQSQAVGPGRAPARCRGERGLRHRALQSGLAGAAMAVRQGDRTAAPAFAAVDAGRVRPRRRPAR